MGDALAAGSLFVAFTLTAILPSSPSPTPAPSQAPLKEIGRVRATTPFCQSLLADAVDAVQTETANDERLDAVLGAMHTADFDSSNLAKFKSAHALTDRYVALRAAAVAGIAEVKRLRANAQAEKNDEQRKALTDFADALGGALNRQKVLADDLGRFIAYLDTHDALSKDDRDRLVFQAQIDQNAASSYVNAHQASMRDFASPEDRVPPLLSTVASDGADDLQQRALPIAKDEKKASDLIDPAFAGC